MFEEAVWSLLPLSLFFLGCVMLWYASWRQHRSDSSPFAKETILPTVSGWISLLLGLLGTAVTTALFFAPLVLIVGAAVIVSGIMRYRQSEIRYLIWSLAEAAQRGIPLEKAARAFASEQGGSIASAARRLADYLDAAMPLSLAMARSGLWVSSEVRLAADIGEKTGTLGPSLQKAIQQSNAFDDTLGSILAKFFYLSCIVFAMTGIVTFMMISVVPTFEEMFREFGIELPAITQLLIAVSGFIVNFWFLLIPFMAALAAGVVIGLLLFVGVPVQSLPIVRYFFSPVDNATVLHSLAIAVQQRQPVLDILSLLSGLTRSPRSRRQLGTAVRRIEDGTHWTDALQYSGFISKAQNAVIRSAERAGNLAWALNEMADSTIRRAAHRAQTALSFLFPACLIGFGVCVFFVAVGMLMPLFSLIGQLT